VRGIGFQQNAGLQQLLCRMFPAMDKGVELLPLRIAECHNVFLYCALFAAHVSAPSLVTRTSIQSTLTKSMTEATRLTELDQSVVLTLPQRDPLLSRDEPIDHTAKRACELGPVWL